MINKLSLESVQSINDKSWQDLISNPLDLSSRLVLLESEFPQAYRSTIWKSLCQPSLKIQALYTQLGPGPFDAIIDKDQSNPIIARVLKAYSVYDTEVGYHASLSTLVTPLLDVSII